MANIPKDEVRKLMDKFETKLEKQLGKPVRSAVEESSKEQRPLSKEYLEFKAEYMPKHMTYYEKACNFSEKFFKLRPDPKKAAELKEAIAICHLNITPSGVASFSILFPMALIFITVFLSYLFTGSLFLLIFFIIAGAALIVPAGKLPIILANRWRMQASNQMVLSVFYVVSFMRHTSNLELAIEFTSKHIAPPLALDLKKILWDVETERYSTVKESMDAYLETWKKWNPEYIESMHLIESSLYEGSEDRRLNLLDKSMEVILEETYEKMLHYAQNLKSPVTMLHMLGIILPILGLVILPLMVNFMEGVKWYHISVLYNIGLPVTVYLLSRNILTSRPTGYGDTDIAEVNPELKQFRKINLSIGSMKFTISPLHISVLIVLLSIVIGLSPIIMKGAPDIGIGDLDPLSSCGQQFCLFGYYEAQKLTDPETGQPLIIGPYGLGASILSILLVLGIGIGVGFYFRFSSKNVMQIREESKRLEDEFASSLFQLGNRLGDGLPAEIAFSRVAVAMEGSVSGNFFMAVAQNITRLGMSVKDAIFDMKYGALRLFPSNLIDSSMKVLVESSKKGPKIAAQALMNMSQYVKQMHRVNERLKDLLADTISSMKSQIKFLTPVIAGIVIGITSMITAILGKLSIQMKHIASSTTAVEGGATTNLPEMFGDGIPTFYFQLIVGIYVLQIVYILTVLTNGIENGADALGEKDALGKNMIYSTATYCVVSLAIMLLFNIVASTIMGKLG